jgi:hypothetical protein
MTFSLKADFPLDGIIAYLTRKHGGNVHEKGIVTITSKSVYDGGRQYPISQLADLHIGSDFWSGNSPNQWICWDFHDLRIRPTRYSIRSGCASSPKSWVVESSIDGVNWILIESQTRNKDLVAKYAVGTYEVDDSRECRFIRLTQTDKNQSADDLLVLSGFEVFGTLIE